MKIIDKNKRLTESFVELCSIESPSGNEKKMAVYLFKKLNKWGWETWIDDSGSKNNSETGNVYSYLEKHKSLDTIVIMAHMDTVQKDGEHIKVVFQNGVFKSKGDTILGADNKAGIASILTAAKLVERKNLNFNILLFFPTREEKGIMGSSFFNFYRTKIRYVFNIDNSDQFGVFVNKALGYLNFKIVVEGKSAHAAREYDKGVDAIKAAGELVSKIDIGVNNKDGWSLNIGNIQGGESTNVVCDNVVMKGEVRAFKDATMQKVISDVESLISQVNLSSGAKIQLLFDKDSYIPPLDNKDEEIEEVCTNICKGMGVLPEFVTAYSTSDANNFSNNYKTISVSRGGMNAHSHNEQLRIEDLELCSEFVYRLMTMK